jgi:hypothetical protein
VKTWLSKMNHYERGRIYLQLLQIVATLLVPFVVVWLNRMLNGSCG